MPIVSEAQLDFHAVASMSRKVEMNRVRIVQIAQNNAMAGMAAHLVRKALNSLTKSCLHGSLRVVRKSYLWFHLALKVHQVLL